MPSKQQHSKPTNYVEHQERTWIEIGQAARLCRTKAVVIREHIAAGNIDALERDGRTFIPLAAANRLKREAGTMSSVKRLNKNRKLPPAGNFGVLAKESMTWVQGVDDWPVRKTKPKK